MQYLFPIVLIALRLAADDPPKAIPTPLSARLLGPMELEVRYDRAIGQDCEKTILNGFSGKSIAYRAIQWGESQSLPEAPPLGRLRIAAARLAEDRGVVILSTDPHPRRASYVLDWMEGPEKSRLGYLYSGVEASWYLGADDDRPVFTEVLQDLEVRPDSGGRPRKRLEDAKRLVLRTSILLPKGQATLVLRGNSPFSATLANEEIAGEKSEKENYRSETIVKSTGEPIDLEITLSLAKTSPSWHFSAIWKTGDRAGIVPASQLALQWLPVIPDATKPPDPPYSLEGGDAKKGAEVFVSESAKCSACHAITGKGGNVGPNLDGLGKRDLVQIYQSIAEPSSVIVPEYLTYTVARKNGQIAVGIVRAEGFDSIRVSDINGKDTTVPKSEIEEMRPSMTSTMPVGLAGALGEEKMRDLIAFLRSGGKNEPKSSKP